MQYHRGLLRQSGHGWGGILKTIGKFATPIIGQVVGGLLGGAPTQQQQGYGGSVPQSGRGFFTDLLKSGAKSVLTAAAKTGLDVLENKRSLKDALKTHGIRAVKETAGMAMPKLQQRLKSRKGDNALIGLAKRGARTGMKVGVRTGLDVLENKRSLKRALATHGRQVLSKRRRKQKGKGFFTDLLKTGAKQALSAAAKTGLDVLENKRSLKDALKTHGIRAAKNTAGVAKRRILARGGPKKQQLTRTRISGKKRQLTKTRASGKKRQPKKKRSLDIFD